MRCTLLIPAFSLPIAPALLTVDLLGHRNAPLPILRITADNPTASVLRLSPATLSAPEHLTSELLRTLSMVAASEPTSWLSVHPDILSHLAQTWGP
jgi:hypothetical protein